MKIISFSHIDQHVKLIQMISVAIPKIELRIKKAQEDIEKAELEVAAFKKLPWYKRWFQFAEPSASWYNNELYYLQQQRKTLDRIKDRSAYDVTIELSEIESDLVYQDGK